MQKRLKAPPRAVALALLLLALVASSGCSRFRSGYPPRPENYPISLTEHDYKEPYVEIRQVKTSAYDDRTVESLGKAELRKLARKYGGDAVIHISRDSYVTEEIAYRPTFFWRYSTRFANKTRLTGVVVRFTRSGEATTDI